MFGEEYEPEDSTFRIERTTTEQEFFEFAEALQSLGKS